MRFVMPGHRGCNFINTIAETANPSHVWHHAAAAHQRGGENPFAALLRDADLDDTVAPDLFLLFEGAVVTAVRESDVAASARARCIAARLPGIQTSE